MDQHRAKRETMRYFGRLWVFLTVTLVAVALNPSALAADRASVPSFPSVSSSTPAQARTTAELFTPVIAKVRIGVHPAFTRLVLELTGAQEFSVESTGRGLRVLVPGTGLDEGIRRIEHPRGLVRSVQFVRRAGGVEILIACDLPQGKLRTLTLTDPDRIVVDIYPPGAEPEALAAEPSQKILPVPSRSPSGGGAASAPAQAKASPQGLPSQESPSPVEGRAAEPSRPLAPIGRGPGGDGGALGETREQAKPLTIVLDPGHGGHDTGAIGSSGLMEKNVVLDLAFRLRKLLQSRLGVRVLMTRSEDMFVPLPERSAFANRAKADFMISLHVNAANARGAVGFETFFFTREPSDSDARASAQRENLVVESNGSGSGDLDTLLKMTLADMAVTRDMKESSNLAERILAALDKILKMENRGVKSGPFYVLASAAMPAVLVESAFITNPREERKLQREDYRQRIAEALYEGIAAYKVRYEQRLGLRTAPSGVGS